MRAKRASVTARIPQLAFWVLGVVFLTSFLLGCAERPEAELMNQLRKLHPGIGPGLYAPLSTWSETLGSPEWVDQLDGGHTYFYWPQHGIAVFTHPQFSGQYSRRDESARIVTSVIFPLRNEITPAVPPMDRGKVVRFEHLVPLRLGGKLISQLTMEDLRSVGIAPASSSKQGTGQIAPISILERASMLLHTSEAGEPAELEIRDTWWLSHYD